MVAVVASFFGTDAQKAVVAEIQRSPTFRSAVTLSFHTSDIPALSRRSPKLFLWYDHNDRLHCVKLGVNGRKLIETCTS